MFRLSKYELRKNRVALLILLAGLAVLEIFFLVAMRMENVEYIMTAVAFLILFGVICYFSVFIFATVNYYREINSRTSYLVFMTPLSHLSIVLSKMFTVLFLGVIIAAVLGVTAAADWSLLADTYDEYAALSDVLKDVLMQWGVNAGEIISNILFAVITFLLSVFSTVAIIYLCITLAATLFQNSYFKVFISVVFFIAAMFGRSKLEKLVKSGYQLQLGESFLDLLYQSWPYALLNLGLLLVCVALITWLLKKKLSL